MKSDDRRPYRMTNRAEAANATSERILDAVTELFWERPTDQVVLKDVAERAGVTVQTVLPEVRRQGGAPRGSGRPGPMSRTGAERAVRPGTWTPRSRCSSSTTSRQGPARCVCWRRS